MNSHNPATFLRRAEQVRPPSKSITQALGLPSRTLTSEAILGDEREVGIEHHGALYRLKLTRQGKLILNK